MKVTLTLNGKSVDLDLTAEQMGAIGLKPEKKTGYEFSKKSEVFYFVRASDSDIATISTSMGGDLCYKNANFYADETVAKNNARADRLIRQLRRFAAEHGGCGCTKIDGKTYSFYEIKYLPAKGLHPLWTNPGFLQPVLFTTSEAAEAAIEAFRDELIWYFTEYDPMAPGYWED